MCIPEYLKKKKLSQQEFATLIGVSQGLVWQWINGKTRITAERAKEIEVKTKGDIKRHDLRSDVFERAA